MAREEARMASQNGQAPDGDAAAHGAAPAPPARPAREKRPRWQASWRARVARRTGDHAPSRG
eukprot:3420740-Pyramimonas_sp.AAC.1